MQEIEFTISTVEIAEMLDNTPHKDILKKLEGRTQKNGKHIKGYIEILNEHQMVPVDFFIPSTYRDSSGKENKCYKVTKKGCEFLANKFTGEKGVVFTARYINRFHEMQDMILEQAAVQEPAIPWFIKKLKGDYIVLERDFIQLTGVDIRKYKGFYSKFKGGLDYNGIGWKPDVDDEVFMQKYGFEFGDEKVLNYFYLNRVEKVLDILTNDRAIHMNPEAYKTLTDGIAMIQKPKLEIQKVDTKIPADVELKKVPKQISISIVLGDVAEIEVR